ncbi:MULTISPECIES: type II toxin-antitoxin system RelE/ParE family toxin [Rufibacter]|uniref:Plasmid stabilization system protein ParE n=1 Tax=Rufibacter quisquiliarum TaxID=1549639 RepID=A0A839G832_9BACT|nr:MULTISPECIES: type II toxin-antitoxin system RelE/ParE family toxin [Rufibacter]MBA9075594.1 plasmid stabilization system protein ParE [Rufibacter quisquiliarum]
MKTTFDIRWSQESKAKFQKIIAYLRAEWTEKEVKKFVKRLKEFEQIVVLFPELYAPTRGGLRRAVLGKHHSVIYRIDFQHRLIRVYTIFDNRQNPASLKG